MDTDKSETRMDEFGNCAVITPHRGKRPEDFATERKMKTTLPSKCFFCPGNESLTPPEIDRVEKDGKWEVRCFPNKFAAFRKDCPEAYGRHEIIVETPDHYKTLSELSEENLLHYLQMVGKRIRDAYSDKRIKYVQVFKNEGHEGGASLEHTHTQLVGMPLVPSDLEAKRKYASGRKCALCKVKRNIFAQNSEFIAFVPHAARFHFEFWIAPKSHSMKRLGEGQMKELANILKVSLSKLDKLVNYPPYNILYFAAPPYEKDFHFHLCVTPRLAKWAGFEHSTGWVMNSVVPEDAAKALKETKV